MSSGWYYGVGIFFSIAAGLLVLRNLYEVLAGKIEDKDLIQVQESEDMQQCCTRAWTRSRASPARGKQR